jgi:hypothetical protein
MRGYWAAAQVVSKMEHIVRREIEKANHGAFVPTHARHQKIDGRLCSKERPTIGGYVFFYTWGRDFAGISDIHGVYSVLASAPDMDTPDRPGSAGRVLPSEMARMMIEHANGKNDETLTPRYTKYYRSPPSSRRKSRKPRSSKRLRTVHTP